MPKHSDFNSIIQKISSKLACWKSKLLNIAGRVTLAKSVHSAIPIHLMQCLPFHKKTTNFINNYIRKFLRGSSDERRKIHLINWAVITQSKSKGGLQIKDAFFQNQAFVVGLAWRFLNNASFSPWTDVLHAKYLPKNLFHPFRIPSIKSYDSPIKKFLVKGWFVCQNHMKWSIGDGTSSFFWFDKWIDNLSSSLASTIHGPLNRQDFNLKVSDLLHNGQWNLNSLSYPLPSHIQK